MPPRHQGGGVDNTKWDDPNHKSMKYQVLRILDQIPPAEARAQFKAGVGPIVDQLKALGFTITSDNKISHPSLGAKSIDVIHGDNTEYGWRDENAITPRTPPTPPPGGGIDPPGGGIGPPVSPPGAPNLPPGGQNPGGTATTNSFYFPEFSAPTFTPYGQFQAPAPFQYGAYTAPQDFTYADYQAGSPYAYNPFTAPTLDEAKQEPGYAFALQQGQKALEGSAAARGMVRTGSHMKDLLSYGQQMGEQNYSNVYNRAQNTWSGNTAAGLAAHTTNQSDRLNTYNTNRGNAFQNYTTNRDTGLAAYQTNRNNAADAYGMNYGASRDAWDRNSSAHAGAYDRNYQGARDMFGARFDASKLTFEDMYRRWRDILDSNTRIATGPGAS